MLLDIFNTVHARRWTRAKESLNAFLIVPFMNQFGFIAQSINSYEKDAVFIPIILIEYEVSVGSINSFLNRYSVSVLGALKNQQYKLLSITR